MFEKEETHKYLDIEIIDDNDWEPDEVHTNTSCFKYLHMFIILSLITGPQDFIDISKSINFNVNVSWYK